MTHLVYITKTNVAKSGAQAIQIRSMASAFTDILGTRFQLRAVCDDPGVDLKNLKPFKFKNRLFFWAEYFFTILSIPKSSRIFTRDVGVAFLAGLFKRQVVLELHHPNPKFISSLLLLSTLSFSTVKYLTISKALEQFFKRAYRPGDGRVLTAHDGAFPDKYKMPSEKFMEVLEKEIGALRQRKLVVHTGSLYKGGAELFGELADRSQILLVHVGGTDAEIDFWRRHYKNATNIILLPQQDQEFVRDLQMTADILLFISVKSSPIFWCTSPLKVFEYMCSGNPIVGTGTGSISEILSKRNAFIFDPDVPGSLIKEVEFAMDNIDEAALRSFNARNDVISQYCWHQRARSINAFFDENISY